MLLLALLLTSLTLADNGCRWPSGKDASDFTVPCRPDQKSSVCCGANEMCLDSGLCFSQGQGFAYRGACFGDGYNDRTCPDFCNDILNETYGNMMGCPFGGYDQGFKNYWCGAGLTCKDTGDRGKFYNLTQGIGNLTNFATGFGNNPVYLLASAQTTPSSTASSTSSSTSSTTSSRTSSSTASPASASTSSTSTSCPSSSNVGAVAGGIAGPLGAAALIFAGLYFFERRKRRQLGHHYERFGTELPEYTPAHPYAKVSELGSEHSRVELPGHLRPELAGHDFK